MSYRHPLLESFDNGLSLIANSMVSRVESSVMALIDHAHGPAMLEDRAFNNDGFWPGADEWEASYRPYVVSDGILHIPVKGVLMHEFGYAVGDWATGYIYIQRAFERGMDDPMVRGIALVINSPGGMVSGNFELVDKMFARKGEKPIRAYASDSAYSAAYSIASVADQIIVTRSGGVGSIGVVTSHLDLSSRMEMEGIKRTWMFKGQHKVDGNSDTPLPADVKARIEARLEETYAVFVSTVARNRPQLSEDEVRATEALSFTAAQSLSNKLADSIGALDDALAAFVADLSQTSGDEEMSTKDEAAAEMQAAVTTAVSKANADAATAQTAAIQAAVAGERARVTGITGSDEAKGRETLANHLASNTSMSLEDAKAILAAAPKATAPEADDSFDAQMQGGNPNVGGSSARAPETPSEDGTDVLALVRGVGLSGFRPASA